MERWWELGITSWLPDGSDKWNEGVQKYTAQIDTRWMYKKKQIQAENQQFLQRKRENFNVCTGKRYYAKWKTLRSGNSLHIADIRVVIE